MASSDIQCLNQISHPPREREGGGQGGSNPSCSGATATYDSLYTERTRVINECRGSVFQLTNHLPRLPDCAVEFNILQL